MASLPTIKRIQRQDMGSNIPEWVDGLLSPLNQFMEEIYSAMNRNLTIPENVKGQFIELEFKTLANYTNQSAFTELTVLNKTGQKLRALLLSQITKKTNPRHNFTTVNINWVDNNNGTITIYFISGLENSTDYKVVLLGV
jgi:hypothetical protein